MGVTQIIVEKTKDLLIYKNFSQKTFFLNGQDIDMKDFNFILKDNILYLEDFSDYGVSLLNGKPYFMTPIFNGTLEEVGEKIKDTKLSLLLLFLNEITLENDVKVSSKSALSSKSQGCSFWNTYTVYAIGNSRSTSLI